MWTLTQTATKTEILFNPNPPMPKIDPFQRDQSEPSTHKQKSDLQSVRTESSDFYWPL